MQASVQAGPAKLGQIIERRIVERTWRRIRQLRVEVCGGRVVVYGQTLWYYAKQIAILAVLDALREAGVTAVLDMRINVSPPPGRDHQLACPRSFPESAREGRTLPDHPIVVSDMSPEVGPSEPLEPVGPRPRRQDHPSQRPVRGKPCIPQLVRNLIRKPRSPYPISGGGK